MSVWGLGYMSFAAWVLLAGSVMSAARTNEAEFDGDAHGDDDDKCC